MLLTTKRHHPNYSKNFAFLSGTIICDLDLLARAAEHGAGYAGYCVRDLAQLDSLDTMAQPSETLEAQTDEQLQTVARPPLSTAGDADPFAAWNAVPLFMRSLPEEQGGRTGPPADDNHVLDALQALLYDAPPSEIAAGFKAQANELFVSGKYRDALGFYTRALDECGKDLPVEEKRTLWCNRAAANLELKNYGATLRDVSLVLSAPLSSYPEPPSASSNKTTLKALLRSARALIALKKLPEALDALQRLKMLEFSTGNEEADVGRSYRQLVEAKMAEMDLKEKKAAEKARRARELEKRVGEALIMKGAILPKRLPSQSLFHNCPTDITPPHFDPDAIPDGSRPSLPLVREPPSSTEPFVIWDAPPPSTPLIIPVFLLLPLAEPPTRDLCLAFHTSSTFGDELRAMEHDPAAFDMYIATKKGRVLKVGAKLELGRVMEAAGKEPGDGWELKEGWALEMVGVPKGEKGASWIANWKETLKNGI